MKHNILPDEWCVANCKSVREYIANEVGLDSKNIADSIKFTGYQNRTYTGKNEPFGQLLTEEQFLYCIGEPTEGEEIEVSNDGFEETNPSNAYLLKIDTNGGAWVVAETDDNTAKRWVDYRRKHLVLKVDKWVKEKAAFVEGKTIQSRIIFSVNKWEENMNPSWSEEWEYRIKPEPKYIRFTREDWGLFKMKEVMFDTKIESTSIGIIIGCDSDGVIVSHEYFSYEYMFKNALFAGGTPFGKLIEE